MLPTLVTIMSFLMELTSSSPVYNMQPAFITNSVGATSGRNIRHLPCISRKNHNQSGVCMFAIDCLKANGTHLGTCIDRFYFGSCCHIPPVDMDNSIENDIIPHREPPLRLSSTTKKPHSNHTITTTTTVTTTTVTTTTALPSSSLAIFGDKKPSRRPTTTTTTPSTTTITTTTTAIPERIETTTSEKLQTFQIVDGTLGVETTTKPGTTTTRKPQSTTTKPVVTRGTTTPTTTVTTTPKPIKPSTTTKKPSNATTRKPSTITTRKPSTTTTKKPSVSTRKPSITTRRSTSKKPAVTTTNKPSTTTKRTNTVTTRTTTRGTTSKKPVTTTKKPLTTTKKPTLTTTSSNVSTKNPQVVSSTVSNEVPQSNVNGTATSAANGNVVTNEIEVAVTLKPDTSSAWEVDDKKNYTKPSFNVSSTNGTEVTAPDAWVLLPSVVASTETSEVPQFSTTTSPPTTILTTIKEDEKEEVPKPPDGFYPAQTEPTTQPVETSTVASTSTVPTKKPVNMSDYTEVCGRRMYPEGRIVGGEKSMFGKWPWQISVRQWRTSTYLHKCGAALLNENWAITAAHCVDSVPPSDLLLRLGEYDLSTESEPYLHQERRVQIIASHPQFDQRTFEYDLALLRFYEPVTFQPNILPVCVPASDENFIGKTAHVTGWGRLYEDGPLPSVLQEVSVPVLNNSVCENMYEAAGYIEHIPHIFICAGWRRGGYDSCEGDSGGPMVIQREDKRFVLAGIISWGIGCAEPNQPGVYTRVSEFRDWINQILQF